MKAALPEGSPFLAGIYVLLRPAFVAPAADIFAPDDDELLAELEEGEAGCALQQWIRKCNDTHIFKHVYIYIHICTHVLQRE